MRRYVLRYTGAQVNILLRAVLHGSCGAVPACGVVAIDRLERGSLKPAGQQLGLREPAKPPRPRHS